MAIMHQICMHEPGEDGYYGSDSAGAEQCEEAWSMVVGELVDQANTVKSSAILRRMMLEADEIGERDEERRKRLGFA